MATEHVIQKTPIVKQTNLRMTSMVRKTLKDQPVLRVRGVWDVEKGEANPIGQALSEIDAAIERQGLNLAGPPYWICPDGTDERGGWRWEAGVPVSQAGVGDGRVDAAVLPGGEVASIYYRGGFERAGEVNAYLRGEIEAAGLTPEGEVRWIGLTDPAEVSDPEDHYSELVWPVTV
ncbi:MAG: GyrI-like domain-containing protein [Acidimicrobiales bacterium]|nr:GyrI-like domain-containing protein [Acidimicrobiales bacterium]